MGLDHEDRPEGRLPSQTGLRQPLKIIPPCSSRNILSVSCPLVWALDDSSGIHQDVSCGQTFAHSGRQCPIPTGTTELCMRNLITKSGTYRTNFSTSSVFELNDQLNHVDVTILTHSGLSGVNFNLERALSPTDSFLPVLTNVLSRLSPSTVLPAR